jgi:hypothetical protein
MRAGSIKRFGTKTLPSIADDGSLVEIDAPVLINGAANEDSLTVAGAGAGQTLSDAALVRANGSGTFDTTAGAAFFSAVVGVADATRSAGSNALSNTGVYGEASGGQANISLYGYQAGSGADDFSLVAEGKAKLTGAVLFTGILSPTTIVGNQNDYDPGASTRYLFIDASTPIDITGISGGVHGRVLTIVNMGSNAISLLNQSNSSTDVNRLITNDTVTIPLGLVDGATFVYRTNRWIHVGSLN